VTNSDSDGKVFLDSSGHGKFEAVPYVEKQNGFEGTCRRCKDKTEVWKIYSHVDKQYLDLCTLDIYEYIVSVPSMVQKSGKVWSKNPDKPSKVGSKVKFWTAKYFCEECNLGQIHSGYSEYIGDNSGIFTGSCDECGTHKSGNTLDLKSDLYSKRQKIEDEKLQAVRLKNAISSEEYFNSAIQQIMNKRKKRSKSNKNKDDQT
jgi:hypothetical protein